MSTLAAEQADWEACVEALAACEARITRCRQADVANIAAGVADLLSEARYELGEVLAKGPRRPAHYAPTRDDSPDTRAHDAAVGWHRQQAAE